jgi:hypothetical protein
VYNADAAHTLPAVIIECLVQSAPDRLVLLPSVPCRCAEGTLRGVRTRFGAHLDLSWSGHGATAVLRPSADRTIEVVAGGDRYPLLLAAGEEQVLSIPRRN